MAQRSFKADIISGARYIETADENSDIREIRVYDVARSPASNFLWRAKNRIQAQYPGTRFGSYHPTIGGLICERIEMRPIGKSRTQAAGTFYYRDISKQRIRINGTLTQELTRFDREGNMLGVNWDVTKASDPGYDATGTGTGERHFAKLPRLVPGTVLEVERLEDAGANDGRGSPLDLQIIYKGKLNKGRFQECEAHTWRCLDVSGESFGSIQTNGVNASGTGLKWSQIFRYLYRFEFVGYTRNGVQNTFDPMLIYLDRHSGEPPSVTNGVNPKKGGFPKKKAGNGWKVAQLDDDADFAKLFIPNLRWRQN